jgi:hypothetical protein
MNPTVWTIWGLSAYCLLFSAAVVSMLIWRSRQRRERPPVKFELLRGPGESLRRRVQGFDENLMLWLGGTALIPLFAAVGLAQVVLKLPRSFQVAGLAVVGLITLAGIAVSAGILYRRLTRWRSDFLGYLGERTVGEHLEPLLAQSYRIFHDVPADGAKADFNLDHVVVGLTGVALIETKTRRKGRARPGFKDHVVVFDGSQLIWPWGEDRHGLEQALAEADWLAKWIFQRTGLKVAVKPILTLPGWWVEQKARGPVTVVNSKSLPSAIRGNGAAALSSEQVDLIARQLDTLCRDVTD